MANYNAVTGHMTSQHADWGADDDEFPYICNCDNRVAYRVNAVGPRSAERKARAQYLRDAGEQPAQVTVTRQ